MNSTTFYHIKEVIHMCLMKIAMSEIQTAISESCVMGLFRHLRTSLDILSFLRTYTRVGPVCPVSTCSLRFLKGKTTRSKDLVIWRFPVLGVPVRTCLHHLVPAEEMLVRPNTQDVFKITFYLSLLHYECFVTLFSPFHINLPGTGISIGTSIGTTTPRNVIPADRGATRRPTSSQG